MADTTPGSSSDQEKAEIPLDNFATRSTRPSKLHWVLTCISICLGSMLYGLDTTIAADVQGPIYKSFGNIEKLPWIGSGFPLGAVAVLLLVGRLYGSFEIKWLLLASIIIFEVGSAICGAAPTIDVLIFGRIIAGIGGSGMFIGGLTYISAFTTFNELPRYNALLGIFWGLGAIIGPLIGGGFSESSATWRWGFYINLPLAAVLVPISVFFYPQFNPQPDKSNLAKLKELDWTGALLHATTFTLFVIVVTFAGSTWAWTSPGSIALWVLLGISLVAYALQQSFCVLTTAAQRMFPVHFLRRRDLVLQFITTAAVAAAFGVTLYYVPIFFQFTRGDSAIKAAVRLLPFIALWVFFLLLIGAVLPFFGFYALYTLIGGIFVVLGAVLMYDVDATSSVSEIYGYEILLAAGTGLVFQNAYAVTAAKVSPEDIPASVGFINVAQIGAITNGLSIAGSIFQNLGYSKLRAALAHLGLPVSELRAALAGVVSIVFEQGGEEFTSAAVNAVVETISSEYLIALVSGVLMILCALCMRWEKLDLSLSHGP